MFLIFLSHNIYRKFRQYYSTIHVGGIWHEPPSGLPKTPRANPERQPCKWGRIDRKELKGSRETRMGKWQGKKGEVGQNKYLQTL